VTARIRCDLAASLKATFTVRVHGKKRAVKLGAAKGAIGAGATKSLFFTLSRSNYARLVAARKLHVRATLVATGTAGKRTTSKTVSLAAPR
jgi:hypothetical protein